MKQPHCMNICTLKRNIRNYEYEQDKIEEDAAYNAISEIFREALQKQNVLPCTFCHSSRHTASKCKKLDVGIHAYNIIKERRDHEQLGQVSYDNFEFKKNEQCEAR
jgi:hypothetical protein